MHNVAARKRASSGIAVAGLTTLATLATIATLAAAGSGCGTSLTPDGLGDTRIRAACHFAFACCSPTERSLFDPVDFKDEGTCVDETERQGSILFALAQQAQDALARTTGTVPYLSAYIWVRPQGSNSDGIRNMLEPAWMRWAMVSLKPRIRRIRSG